MEHKVFVNVVVNVGTWFATVPGTKNYFNWITTLQLINDILSVPQKLLRYFNGTIISNFLCHSFLFVLLFTF